MGTFWSTQHCELIKHMCACDFETDSTLWVVQISKHSWSSEDLMTAVMDGVHCSILAVLPDRSQS